MKCKLIQTTRIPPNNRAEIKMQAFLTTNMPADYFVYREFKLTGAYKWAYDGRTVGVDYKRPDFLLVGPRVGLISIEVKQWNIDKHTYDFVDQETVRRTSLNGDVKDIDNPTVQRDAYRNALMDLLKQSPIKFNFWVTSLIAFPQNTKAEFINQIPNIELLRNPQTKHYLDLERVIFKDDVDRFMVDPERFFLRLHKQAGQSFNYGQQEIDAVNNVLLPPSFCIGSYTKRQANQKQRTLISEEQQKWIFGLDRKQNYLFDVPGSGKTNALVSKAIHLVDLGGAVPPKILITTYSKNLETNIERILKTKLKELPDKHLTEQSYKEHINILCVPGLYKTILKEFYDEDQLDSRKTSLSGQNVWEQWMRDEVNKALDQAPDLWKKFDHIFIDEIQDLDDNDLIMLSHFGKDKSYFIVGDIGQKIRERSCDLERLGIIPHRVELPKTYQMYRTPRNIAMLAVRFVMKDPYCRRDFESHGYRGDFQYRNQAEEVADFRKSDEPVADVVGKIREMLDGSIGEDDILVITSDALLDNLLQQLQHHQIKCTIGEPEKDGCVALVAFQDAKGLEREVVIVADIEDLYNRTKPDGLLWDEDVKITKQGLSRRMIYVAITRTIEQLTVFYQDPDNPFVADLLKENDNITRKLLDPNA